MYKVWNVHEARPTSGALPYRQALRLAHLAEMNSGDHYTVVPA